MDIRTVLLSSGNYRKYFLLAELQTICKGYHARIEKLEGDKYDLEVIERFKAFEVHSIHDTQALQFFIILGRSHGMAFYY